MYNMVVPTLQVYYVIVLHSPHGCTSLGHVYFTRPVLIPALAFVAQLRIQERNYNGANFHALYTYLW